MPWNKLKPRFQFLVSGFSFLERSAAAKLPPGNKKPETRNFLLAITLIFLLMASAPSAEEKQLSVYGPQVNYSLPVWEHNGQDYVALLEVLEPFGNVNATADGDRWKLRFNSLEVEFRKDAAAGKVAGQKLTLPAPFVLEDNRGLVPLRALPGIVGRLLGTKTEYHEAARRLFVGGAGTHFTTDFGQGKLTVSFSAAVNPSISTEPGRLRMTFNRDPVVSATYLLRQENPLASLVMFSEDNGQAELVIEGRMPLLAQFSADRKTIDIVAAPGAAQTAAAQSAVAVPPPPTLQSLTAKPPFVVMLDAGHGGDDLGAMLNETLEEKTVTLVFARRLRNELQNHGINVIMARDADVTVPLEQRAAMADAARVAVYLGLHATSQGSGVRVYTAMLNSASAPPGTFLPWDTAQAKYLLSSRALSDIVRAEFGKHEIPSAAVAAPVLPLNHLAAAALAVEIGPPSSEAASVNAGVFQQRVATALAEAIVVGRSRVEAER